MPQPTRALRMVWRNIQPSALQKGSTRGKAFERAVVKAGDALEAKYPRITTGEIKGTMPHKSHKDPSDNDDVITVQFFTNRGTRFCTIHAHEDGTWNEFWSRAGKDSARPGDRSDSKDRREDSKDRRGDSKDRRGDSKDRRGDSKDRRGDSKDRRGDSKDRRGDSKDRRGDSKDRRGDSKDRRGDSKERGSRPQGRGSPLR